MSERAALFAVEERTTAAQLRFFLLRRQHDRLQELLVSTVALALIPHLSQSVLELPYRLTASERASSLSESRTLARDALLLLRQAGVRATSPDESGAFLLHLGVGNLQRMDRKLENEAKQGTRKFGLDEAQWSWWVLPFVPPLASQLKSN